MRIYRYVNISVNIQVNMYNIYIYLYLYVWIYVNTISCSFLIFSHLWPTAKDSNHNRSKRRVSARDIGPEHRYDEPTWCAAKCEENAGLGGWKTQWETDLMRFFMGIYGVWWFNIYGVWWFNLWLEQTCSQKQSKTTESLLVCSCRVGWIWMASKLVVRWQIQTA